MCRLRQVAAVTLFWMMQSQLLWAWEGSYSLTAAVQNNDNVSLSPIDETSAVETELGLQVDYTHDSAFLSSGIQGGFLNRAYSQDDFDVEHIVDASAFANFSVIPNNFHWYGSAFATQTLIDVFSADTPQNRTNVNRYSTGPDFIFRLSEVTNLSYHYRYQIDQVGDDLIPDTISTQNILNLSRRFGPLTSISLNGSQSSTYLDDGGENLETDTVRTTIGITRNFKTAMLNLAIGETEITLPNGGSAKGGSSSASLNYTISPESRMLASYNQNIYDSSVDLLSQFRAVIEDLPVIIDRNVYEDKTSLFQLSHTVFAAVVTLTWSKTDHDSLESLLIIADEESNLPLSGDSQSELLRVGVVSGQGKASHSFALSQLAFSEIGDIESADTETMLASYQLAYRFSNSFSGRFFVRRTNRDNNNIAGEATANLIGASIDFTY